MEDANITHCYKHKLRCFVYENDSVLAGYHLCAKKKFFTLSRKWSASHILMRYNYDVQGKSYSVVRASVAFDGTVVCCYGTGFERENAIDAACFNLVETLLESYPKYYMPEYLICYPYLDSFAGSFLVPMFHFQPFVRCLISSYFKSIRSVGEAEPESGYERSFHWLRFLWTRYERYFSDSGVGVLPVCRPDFLAKYGLEGCDLSLSNIFPKPPSVEKLYTDIGLPYGLVNDLKNFCNLQPKANKVDNRKVFPFLMRKLASEIPGFMSDFFLQIEYVYTCRYCAGGPFTNFFSTPVINIPYGSDFQEYIEDAHSFGDGQKLRCNRMVNGMACVADVKRIKSCRYLNTPVWLCIEVGEYDQDEAPAIPPDNLVLHVKGVEYSYVRYANTYTYEVYKGSAGQSYGKAFRDPVLGDVSIGKHTIWIIKTRQGFVQINDGWLAANDFRVLPRVSAFSTWFYVLKRYASSTFSICPGQMF